MLCLLSSFAVVMVGLAATGTILIPFARGLAVKSRDIY